MIQELKYQQAIDASTRIANMRAGGAQDNEITAGLHAEGFQRDDVEEGFRLANIVRSATDAVKGEAG